MTHRIVARASADAIEAFRWIAERSPDAASRRSAGLQKTVVELSQLPDRNPVAEEESEQGGIPLRRDLSSPSVMTYKILCVTSG